MQNDEKSEQISGVVTDHSIVFFTPVAEKGSNLSGGQCQRLALARALLHDSPVYIFDEATSNVDVESENDIMREIYALAEEKTVILISHRLFNVMGADKIYVLDNGALAESGRHEELLAMNNGVYQSLWKAQQELERYSGGEDRLREAEEGNDEGGRR